MWDCRGVHRQQRKEDNSACPPLWGVIVLRSPQRPAYGGGGRSSSIHKAGKRGEEHKGGRPWSSLHLMRLALAPRAAYVRAAEIPSLTLRMGGGSKASDKQDPRGQGGICTRRFVTAARAPIKEWQGQKLHAGCMLASVSRCLAAATQIRVPAEKLPGSCHSTTRPEVAEQLPNRNQPY